MSLEQHSLPDPPTPELTIQRDKLQQDAQNKQLLLAPIYQMPIEVLPMIFKHSLPNRRATMNPDEVPLVLGRVCSVWRQISFSTPELWTTLHIDDPFSDVCPDPTRKFTQPYFEAVEAWLNRSSDLPLSISLVHGYSDADRTRGLLDVLVKFAPRWKQIAVHLSNDDSLLALTAMSETDVPLLRTVALEIRPSRDEYTPLSFLNTSSLRSVSLSVDLLDGPASLPIQWANITDLSLWGSLSIQTAVAFLRACPNLVACKLKDLSFDTGYQLNKIKLSFLKVLRMKLNLASSEIGSAVTLFFSTLDMPNLSHFECNAYKDNYIAPFYLIFTRPNTIATFDYTLNNMPADVLVLMLMTSSSIRRLRLNVLGQRVLENTPVSVNNAFLARLASETNVCPALEELDLRLDANCDITEDTLLQFILSRTVQAPAGVARLKSVHVVFTRPCHRDIMPDLRALIDDGLQVQISYRQAGEQPYKHMFSPWALPDPSDELDGIGLEFWAPLV